MSEPKELEIKLQFLEEAKEHLNTIELLLLELDSSRINQQMNAIFRAAHSIKGGAEMKGFEVLTKLSHRLENFFRVLKTENKDLEGDLQCLLLRAVDYLHQVITWNYEEKEISEDWLITEVNPLFDQLQARLGEPQNNEIRAELSEIQKDMIALIFKTEINDYLEQLESILADSHRQKLQEECLILAQQLSGLGEILDLKEFTSLCNSIIEHLETEPDKIEEIAQQSLEKWRQSQTLILKGEMDSLPTKLDGISLSAPLTKNLKPHESGIVADISLSSDHQQVIVDSQIEYHATGAKISGNNIPSLHIQEKPYQTVRVSVKSLDQLNSLCGKLTIESNTLDLRIRHLQQLFSILNRRVATIEQSQLGKVDAQVSNISLKEVKTDLELTLKDTEKTVKDLSLTSNQLQTAITQVRMRPFSDIISTFPRALHDLCLEYGKKVELKIYGEETLIERKILESLSDPLVHLLRNAFAHGIESPATRINCGKSPQGLIEISVRISKNQLLITVTDDGAGVNISKMRQKAQLMGFDASSIALVKERELLELIFEPGFSTMDQITTLSGRGVGMDVVRTNLNQIGGNIEIDTKQGIGTTFIITVPFTLLIIPVILVESNGILFAFPKTVTQKITVIQPKYIFTYGNQQIILWQDHLLSIFDMSEWLEFPPSAQIMDKKSIPIIKEPNILLVSKDSHLVGLKIDRYWGEQEVVIRPTEAPDNVVNGLNKCTVLGDTRIVWLVDTFSLLPKITHPIKLTKNQVSHTQKKSMLNSTSTQLALSAVTSGNGQKDHLSLSINPVEYALLMGKSFNC